MAKIFLVNMTPKEYEDLIEKINKNEPLDDNIKALILNIAQAYYALVNKIKSASTTMNQLLEMCGFKKKSDTATNNETEDLKK